jgi:hypothetical protein
MELIDCLKFLQSEEFVFVVKDEGLKITVSEAVLI